MWICQVKLEYDDDRIKGFFLYFSANDFIQHWESIWNQSNTNSWISGLPKYSAKAQGFHYSTGLQPRPLKFYSKYLAFVFSYKISCSEGNNKKIKQCNTDLTAVKTELDKEKKNNSDNEKKNTNIRFFQFYQIEPLLDTLR